MTAVLGEKDVVLVQMHRGREVGIQRDVGLAAIELAFTEILSGLKAAGSAR